MSHQKNMQSNFGKHGGNGVDEQSSNEDKEVGATAHHGESYTNNEGDERRQLDTPINDPSTEPTQNDMLRPIPRYQVYAIDVGDVATVVDDDNSNDHSGSNDEQDQNGIPVLIGEEIAVEGMIVHSSSKGRKKKHNLECLLAICSILVFIALVCIALHQISSNETSNEISVAYNDTVNQTTLEADTPTISYYSPDQYEIQILNQLKKLLIPISGEALLDDVTSYQNYCWQKMSLDFPSNIANVTLDINKDKHIIIQRYAMFSVAMGTMLTFFQTQDRSEMLERRLPYDCDGSTCNENGNVTQIVIINRWSTRGGGIIANELGELKKLKYVILSRNSLRSTIPTEIGKLQDLHTLDLQKNLLSGSIPKEIGLLTNLRWLYLNDNNLTGTIPSTLSNLHNLEYIDFSGNFLSGTIPISLLNLKNLKGIGLDHNNLTIDIESLSCPSEKIIENLTYSRTVNLGKSWGLDSIYTYEADFQVSLDCGDEKADFYSCSCCQCKM